MWDLSGPGLEPVSPALASGFLTTVPPGKPNMPVFGVFTFNNAYNADDNNHFYQSLYYVPDTNSNCFTCINLFNAHDSPMREVFLLPLLSLHSISPFKDEENTERLRHFLCSLFYLAAVFLLNFLLNHHAILPPRS